MLEEVLMLSQGIKIDLIDQEQRRGHIRACGRGLGDGLAKRRLIKFKRDHQNYISLWHAMSRSEKC